MQKLGRFVLASPVKAGILALALMFLPWPFCMAAAVVVGLATLSREAKDSAVLLAWVILPAAAATWKAPAIAMPYDVSFMLCVVTWIYAVALRQLRNWSRLLEFTLGLGLLYLGLLQALPAAWYDQATSHLQQQVMDYLAQLVPADMSFYRQMLSTATPYLLSGLYAGFALVSVGLLMLARVWQLQLGAVSQQALEFYGMRIDRRVSAVAVALMVATFVWPYPWLMMAAQYAVLPFIVAGMSLLAFMLKFKLQFNKVLRLVCLVLSFVLLLLVPKVLMAFIVLGVADSFVNIRKFNFYRIKRASS